MTAIEEFLRALPDKKVRKLVLAAESGTIKYADPRHCLLGTVGEYVTIKTSIPSAERAEYEYCALVFNHTIAMDTPASDRLRMKRLIPVLRKELARRRMEQRPVTIYSRIKAWLRLTPDVKALHQAA